MSGVAVITYLLTQNAALVAQVPATRIRAGVLPLKTPLPAIAVQEVDGFPRLTVAMTAAKELVTERVQVTVLTADYPKKKQLLALVRKALPVSRGTVNGVQCDSVLPDIVGPDLDDAETGIYSQSQDFFVKWHQDVS